MIHESGGHLKPSDVLADLEQAVARFAARPIGSRRSPTAWTSRPPSRSTTEQFAACCKLAKATKVVTITVRSAELGTPFNAEVERLRRDGRPSRPLEGVRVGLAPRSAA